jgi:hypothetical protein
MSDRRVYAVAACAVLLALSGCGKDEAPAPEKKTAKPAVEQVPPYTYPAPVKGHFKETNVGEFEVVDGIAFSATNGKGTVVYVTSKAIASPMLADSVCPMTQARALSQLRDAAYMEVTLVNGKSNYFLGGKSFGGSMREEEVGGRYWQSKVKDEPDRAVGSVVHKRHGYFDYDLPLSKPTVNEISQGDWMHGTRDDPTAPKPSEQAVRATYQAVHDAALKRDLKALLAAQGFDARQIGAIRGLAGIDADFVFFSERFLNASAPLEFSAKPGRGTVRVEGANPSGKKFANYYHFMPCGGRLMLVAIAENPQ